jgi:outer membrane immunogenic protein
MKKLLLSGVAAVAIMAAVPASAADLGPRPAYKAAPIAAPVPIFSWTGCHVGVHAGWGWGKHRIKEHTVESLSSGLQVFDLSGSIDTSGAIFGGQVGCDYQFAGRWVIGVEGSFSGTDINGVGIDPGGLVNEDFGSGLPLEPTTARTIRVKTDALSSVTARLGFSGLLPQTLWYVKGGVAWSRDKWDFSNMFFESFNGTDNPTLIQRTSTGWTIGAGIEWAFAPNWSAFAEWDHYDFGWKVVADNIDDPGGTGFNRGILSTHYTIETARVGVNYHFNFGKTPIMARY